MKGLVLVAVALGAALALAAPPAYPATVDLAPVLSPVIDILATAAVTAALALLGRVWSWLGLQKDAAHRAALEAGAVAAINWAADVARAKVQDVSQLSVRSQIVASAAQRLLDCFPDAASHFGLTEAAARDFVRARVASALGASAAASS